jgi:hypothetical protein
VGVPIIGVQAAQRARKKPVPKGKVQMYITPGWEEPEEEPPPVESRSGKMLTDEQKKLKRLQRA